MESYEIEQHLEGSHSHCCAHVSLSDLASLSADLYSEIEDLKAEVEELKKHEKYQPKQS